MRIIQTLSDMISEEIGDADKYVTLALEKQAEYPELARTLYTISTQEMDHMRMLHDCVAQIIRDYREEHGDPPAAMQAVYEFLHRKQIEAAALVKSKQALYKGE